jgi:hypothetical protein
VTEFTDKHAIVVTCDTCGEQSKPCNDEQAESFRQRHIKSHEIDDLRDFMEQHGHKIKITGGWVASDEGWEQATCSCSWKSPKVNMGWGGDKATEHLREEKAKLDAEPAQA